MKIDLTEFEASPWNSITEDELALAGQVPTMLSEDEQRLYYWLTRHWTRDEGKVVDLGCFVGGSTARLAAGLADAGRNAEVHAFDRFSASRYVKESILYPLGVEPFKEPSILPLAIEYLNPWTNRIELHPGQIEEKTWDGGAIELLVMDASKSAASMDKMAETFFPHLIAGRSLVVQQDYLHWKQPWVPLQMQRMRRWFKPVAYCPRDTMIFACVRKVTPDATKLGQVGDMTDEIMMRALRRIRRRMHGWGFASRIRKMRDAVAANPGVRESYLMKDPDTD